MYVKKLKLLNFRNYKTLDLNFDKGVNIIVGKNAQGKTNILESIYYCSIMKSHRTSKDREIINWDSDYSYIKALICKKNIDKTIEIKLLKEGKKGVIINSKKIKKFSELMGVFNVVMFSPEDLAIVKGGPAARRKLLDIEISKLSKKYYYALSQYHKVLNERNSIIKKYNNSYKNMIDIYNIQLSKYGAYIISKREEFINYLNNIGISIHREITLNEKICFKYDSNIKYGDNVQSCILESLRRNLKMDVERKTTLLGPHRDDFLIYINGIDARKFGSQGQQRTAVLTIKLAILNIVKEVIGEYPVLLLDDVLSELDKNRQKFILGSIKNIQTLITCTGVEEELTNYTKNESVKKFYVENGTIKE